MVFNLILPHTFSKVVVACINVLGVRTHLRKLDELKGILVVLKTMTIYVSPITININLKCLNSLDISIREIASLIAMNRTIYSVNFVLRAACVLYLEAQMNIWQM